MEFRDLKRQYQYLKNKMDISVQEVIEKTNFIQGNQVSELETTLADYTGMKHCISCANGTDALQLALMAWNVGPGDAVFVPDFTFFSSGEVVAAVGAVPVFVDVEHDTYNMDCDSLERLVKKTAATGKLVPKVIISVDLFGQPADYKKLKMIASKYQMFVLEDAAQGFGGRIDKRPACTFGDISTTSFFPAKPFGCYGDGGAIFTNHDEWANLLRSYRVHGKGRSKYDNVRIGMNSRLDTLQAAVLLTKFPVFVEEELEWEQNIAKIYTEQLRDYVKTPSVKEGFYSSWAQYTIQLADKIMRDGLQMHLKEHGIPSAVYYPKPMHRQEAFCNNYYDDNDYPVTNRLSEVVLSLPFHPYMKEAEIKQVSEIIIEYVKR